METRREVLTGAAVVGFAATLPALPAITTAARVLVIEGEPAVANVMAKLLTARGFDTVAANSGIEALQLVKSGVRPSAIITDTVLPDMGGIELLTLAWPWVGNAPVLFLSRYGESRAAFGGGDFMAKPLNIRQLAEWVRSQVPH